jgi:SPX domain protein involved in polyphosphate accumulation
LGVQVQKLLDQIDADEIFIFFKKMAMGRSLNMMAFVKILKKFEKISGKQVLSVYLKVVESSYFNCSDEARIRFALLHSLPLCPVI